MFKNKTKPDIYSMQYHELINTVPKNRELSTEFSDWLKNFDNEAKKIINSGNMDKHNHDFFDALIETKINSEIIHQTYNESRSRAETITSLDNRARELACIMNKEIEQNRKVLSKLEERAQHLQRKYNKYTYVDMDDYEPDFCSNHYTTKEV